MFFYLKASCILIYLWLVSYVESAIYGTPLVFYSQLFQLSTVTPGSMKTFSAPTTTAQSNIVRTGIALAQFSKPSDQYHAFSAQVTAGGTTTSSFTITVNLTEPTSGMKMSYFLIVIKTQTTQVYIDFVHFTWGSGTNLDNTNDSNRTIDQTFTLTSVTQFTTMPSGITARSLTTSFTMYPKTSDGDYEQDNYIYFKSSCSISSGVLTVSLRAYDETRIKGFKGIALIYSNTTVNTVVSANGWNMSMYHHNWQDPSNYSLVSMAPLYGPSFHNKCIFGFNMISYRGNRTVNSQFTISAKGNFVQMVFPSHDDVNPEGHFFCFGNASACGENQTMTDNISLTCHLPTQCPLPQFTGWTDTLFCPKCTQLICQNCTVTNRSNCLLCGVNSTLASGACVCNPDSWPRNTPISTSSLGQWNNVASSLTECKYNCTAQIAGCMFDKCTSGTFCNQCLVGFYLNVTSSTTDQNCISCTTITNCLQCTGATACTLCISGYYADSGACTSCNTAMPNCVTCTDATTCTLCETGYQNISSSVCQCSPSFNNMLNCDLCTLLTACDQCVNTTFFISTNDSMCHSCRTFDLYCMTCSADQFCLSCDIGYTVLTGGITQNCISCTTITKCLQCSDPTTCTLCVSDFVPVAGVCTSCDAAMPNCVTCTDATTCTLCETGYQNISSSVCQCSPSLNNMVNCDLCTLSNACDRCVNTTFFISTNDSMCHSCRKFDLFCITCTAYQVCDSCDPGYTVVTVGLRSLCQACWSLFPNCTVCSSPTACDVCNYTYGLTTALTCQICTTLHMRGCEACTDSTACELCVNQTYLVGGKCYKCDYIQKCVTCFVNSLLQLECLTCLSGFFIKTSELTGQPECKACMHFTSYCETCTNRVCLSCVYPYLPGSDGLCSRCEQGFYFVSGICTNIAGCIRAAYLSNGTTTCLACAPQLFFIYDSRTRKCVCLEGFQDASSAIGPLPECKPVCGDGIVVREFEECDDKNTFPKDGCDRNCKVQPGFDCGFFQPSQCILVLNIVAFEFNYVMRVLGENKAVISYTIEPGHPGLQMRPWDKIINLKFAETAVNQSRISYSYQAQTGQLLITVPYIQELEGTTLEVELTLDPSYIQSTTPYVSLVHTLNGINAKLIFENESELQTHKNMNIITLVLTVILLLVFYLGSYVHKMIGLETIQVIQAIYFVRMTAPSSSSSLLSSINSIRYACSGLQNAEWIYGDTNLIQNQLNEWTSQKFTAINLHKLFLLNANFSLIPIFIALIAYIVSLVKKYRLRNEYLETKEQEQKDKYTQFQRSSQWVYDHFVFPQIMMFNLLSFFQCISLLSEPFQTKMEQLKKIETQSFIFHVMIVLCTTMIYCYEVSNSFEDYTKYRMTQKQRERVPKSVIEKLEHDENNKDRANYHPAYVLCHLAYYFILSVIMIISVFMPDFSYPLEFTMGIAFLYLVLIWVWKPYHEAIGSHNHFLKLYYGTYVLFLVICYLFGKVPKLEGTLYTVFMYVIMTLIGGIIMAGFVRIVLELRFRKALENDSRIMNWNNEEKSETKESKRQSSQDGFLKDVNRPNKTKRQQLVERNNYTLDNQLLQMNQKLSDNLSPRNQPKLSSAEKQYLMKKVQNDIEKKKINLILQNYAQKPNLQFDCESGLSQTLSNAPLKEEQKGDATMVESDQRVENHKKSSFLDSNERHKLNQLKQKLRTQWVYMHEQ